MIATLLNPPRRRRRRRNSWKGSPIRHRRAAYRAWRKRRRKGSRAHRRGRHRRVGRPRTRGRRRTHRRRRARCTFDKALGYKIYKKSGKRCGRGKKRAGSTGALSFALTPVSSPASAAIPSSIYYNRRKGRNPGLIGGATAGLSTSVLSSAVPVGVGMIGQSLVNGWINRIYPTSGILSYVSGLLSIGATGVLAGFIAPKYTAPIVLGGAVNVIRKIVKDNLTMINVNTLAELGEDDDNLEGLEDYLTVANAKSARNLMGMGINPLVAQNPFASFDPSGSIPTTDEVIDVTASAEIV